MIAKAAGLQSDQVFFDLEDSVAPSAKEEARGNVVRALRDHDWTGRVRAVRVNDVTTPWTLRDLTTVVEGAGGELDAVLVPKVTDAGQVAFVDHVLTHLEREQGVAPGRIGLELQIEDATGLLDAREILAASDRVETIIFGPGDMAAALGMPALMVGEAQPDYPGDHWHHVLVSIVLFARDRGIQPIDGPYARIRDLEGLEASSRRARALGFDGKWVLHPDQIETVNEIFGVSQEAFERANDLLDAYAHATGSQARGAVMFGDEMIDEATRKMAEVTLARGRAQGLEPRPTPDDVDFHDRSGWRSTNGGG